MKTEHKQPFVCRTKHKEARRRLGAILMLKRLIEVDGVSKSAAYEAATRKYKFSHSSIDLYLKLTDGLGESDWFWALFPGWSSPGFRRAEIPKAAWDIFKSDYLRAQSPSPAECYKRLKRIAEKRGWKLPHKRTFARRILQEISPKLIAKARGPQTAARARSARAVRAA